MTKDIYVVRTDFEDGEIYDEVSFSTFNAAADHFMKEIGTFFVESIHDAQENEYKNKDLKTFLDELYPKGFSVTYEDGVEISSSPTEQQFNEHGGYAEFNFSDSGLIVLKAIPYTY